MTFVKVDTRINKKGRPKKCQGLVSLMEEILQEKAGAGTDMTKLEALCRKLIKLAFDGDMSAIREVLDRTYGKPHQSIESTGNPITLILNKDDSNL